MSPARKGHAEIPKTPERFRIKRSIPECSELAQKGFQTKIMIFQPRNMNINVSSHNNVNLQS